MHRQVVAWSLERPAVVARQWTRPEEVVQAVVAWSLQRPGRWWPGQAVGQARGSCPGGGGLVAAEARQWTRQVVASGEARQWTRLVERPGRKSASRLL